MIHPQPKPPPVILDRVQRRFALEAKARAFRRAVWARDGACCCHCGRRVLKTHQTVSRRGEVHHRHGRRVRPEDRFNPDMAVLLCSLCHADPAVIARFRT